MANGTDSEEFVFLSGIRTGLKREFAFALKVQSELSGSLGRTRSSKVLNSPIRNGVSANSRNKRFKSSNYKEETTNDAAKFSASEEPQKITVKSPSEVESQIHLEKSRSEKELQKFQAKSPSEEEPKNDLVQSLSEEEPQRNEAKSSIEDETKIDLVESPGAEQPKNDPSINPVEIVPQNDTIKSPMGDGAAMETPIVVDDSGDVKVVSLEKPGRRFTRSALKPKVDLMVSSSAASSSSAVSEDAKSEVIAKTSGSILPEDAQNEAITRRDRKTNVGTLLKASPKRKLEMKMSKKIASIKLPTRIKELLETGMLEGLPVKYLSRANKVKIGLRGTIRGHGILCYCSSCKGREVVTPVQFEHHAGSANKYPAAYIFLENGNSIRHVLNELKGAPLDMLESVIQNAIGSSSPVKKPSICQNCKGSIGASHNGKIMLLCNSCLVSEKSQASPATVTAHGASATKFISPQNKSSPGKITIKFSKCVSPQNKSSKGKLTRKDLRLHKLVFEEDGLPDGTELAYYARGQKFVEGYKKGFGIFCRCCNTEISPSQFEAHAGWASRRKPYLHIYTSNGVSLHELSISLSKGRKLSAKDNDDLCSICADGGNLLLCDGCPRAFHKDCASLSNIPNGDWYCKYCQNMFQREKFVQHNANAFAAGRVSGVDPIEQITKRCIRIVKTPETEVGGCVLCRCHGFSKRFGPRTVILCDQCEKEYHVGCLKDHQMADLKELPKGKWFCCTDCNRIHSALQKLIVRGSERLPDSLTRAIKKKPAEEASDTSTDLDVRWMLLSGKMATPETKLLLSKAVAIFHDRFDPIVDSTTGRDLIPSMVYGRTIRDQEFGGMYCALLTTNSSVVSAGILRIFGREIAELPLVATTRDSEGQGYFQSLFSCIERLLGFLHIEKLVLPSADEAKSIWTDRFGFKVITQEQLSEYRKRCQTMTFEGTSMLEKAVPKCRIVGKSTEK